MSTTEYTFPAYWASAIVNGDYSSLEPAEAERCRRELAAIRADGWSLVDVARGENGDAQEPRFTRCYDLYDPGAGVTGGEVLDFVAIKD